MRVRGNLGMSRREGDGMIWRRRRELECVKFLVSRL